MRSMLERTARMFRLPENLCLSPLFPPGPYVLPRQLKRSVPRRHARRLEDTSLPPSGVLEFRSTS